MRPAMRLCIVAGVALASLAAALTAMGDVFEVPHIPTHATVTAIGHARSQGSQGTAAVSHGSSSSDSSSAADDTSPRPAAGGAGRPAVSLPLVKPQVLLVEQKHQYICQYMASRRDEAQTLKGVGLGRGCAPACPGFDEAGGRCVVLTSPSQKALQAADAVVYHPGRNLPVEKAHPAQWTAMWYGESKEKHPEKYTPAYLRKYDAHVVYEPWSSYRFTWTQRFLRDFSNLDAVRREWVPWEKRRTAVAVVSNCKYHTTNRTQVMQAIDTLLQKHSNGKEKLYMFGSCHPGRGKDSVKSEHPQCKARSESDKYKEKMCILRQYRYVVSLDNSRDSAYVTEKVYHSLLSGAVPIYAGAPDIARFVPLPSAVLGIDTSASMEPLVKRLLSSTDQRTAPPETAWWDTPPEQWSAPFRENLHLPNPACTMCADIAAGVRPRDAGSLP